MKSSDWVGLFSPKRAVLAAVCGAMTGSSVLYAGEFPSYAAIGAAAGMILVVLGLGASLSRLAATVATLYAQVANLSNAYHADGTLLANLKNGLDEISPSVRLSDKRLANVESRQSTIFAEIEAQQAARQQMLDDAYLTLRADAARLIELQSLIQNRMASLEKQILEKLERLMDARGTQAAADVQNLHAELLQRQDLLLDMATALRVELASAKDLAKDGQKPAEAEGV